MTDPLTYSPDEVATILGLHSETVYRWLRSGRMPGRKVGGLWIISRAKVAALQAAIPRDYDRPARLRIAAIEALYCPLRPRATGSRTCAVCGRTLPKQRTRWCNRRCATEWLSQHSWRVARATAIVNAGGDDAPCARCGIVVGWRGEVNHIVPREGRGYRHGCHHHQSNLELLCHGCHVKETARQRADRRANRRAALA